MKKNKKNRMMKLMKIIKLNNKIMKKNLVFVIIIII